MLRWNDTLLDSMRQHGDPMADRAIAALFAEQQTTAMNTLLKLFVHNDAAPPEAIPPTLREFFLATETLPDWADRGLLERGSVFFGRCIPHIMLILNCYSLPASYTMRKGVQVLHRTARLHANPRRRIMETGQMIIDVLRPDGLAAGGYGIRSVQKVRLMHAAVRHLVQQQPWDSADLGVPINQEDMAGTLNTFGYLVLDGLQKLGIEYQTDEAEAYLHTWAVVGHLMGVHPVLRANNAAEAEILSHRIADRNYEPCDEGRELMTALLDYFGEGMPRTPLTNVPVMLMRHFMGDEPCDAMHLPPANALRHTLKPLRMFNRLAHKTGTAIEPLGEWTAKLGYQMLDMMLQVERGSNRTPFAIPSELRETWGIRQ